MRIKPKEDSQSGPIKNQWRRAVATISVLWLATAAGAGLTFAVQMLMARKLGPEEYGLFASSLATVSMVASVAGFGLSQFLLKAYGREGWQANRWIKPSVRFLVTTIFLAIAIVAIWSWQVTPDVSTRVTLLALLPVILGVLAVDLMGSMLRLEERFRRLALWQLLIPLSRLVVVGLMLASTLTASKVAFGYGLASLAVALLAIPPLRAMSRGDLRLSGHGEDRQDTSAPMPLTALDVWRQAWPFGAAAILYSIFIQVSTVLLKYMDDDARAGMFGIAMAVMMAIYLIPTTVYQKFLLGKLYRWSAQDPLKFWSMYWKGVVVMLSAGLLIAALMLGSVPWVVPWVLGDEYRSVIGVLMVLALCVPIRFVATAVGSALISGGHMRYRVFAVSVATIVTIIFNIILIPHYQEQGAAIAVVAGEVVLFTAIALGVSRFRLVERQKRWSGVGE
jgi:O-antigen/teichoic acid export membrane protein